MMRCPIVLQHVYRTCIAGITPGSVMSPKFVHIVLRVEPKAGFHYSDSCVGEASAVALFNSSR